MKHLKRQSSAKAMPVTLELRAYIQLTVKPLYISRRFSQSNHFDVLNQIAIGQFKAKFQQKGQDRCNASVFSQDFDHIRHNIRDPCMLRCSQAA